MGSKGSNTTTTSQNQTYTANPVVSAAGTQAINMATNAANTPFNAPVAPVAGLTPDQLQAFQQYRNIQGMAQPYYNQAQGYIMNSAAPITGQDVANYYNPMASNVLANLHESQGQQMNDLTGRLSQTAGGVGASRIAVGQSELARQHQLAEGQTLSGLYDRALQAAQQQKQMSANAGYGMTNLGTTAQGAALQGTGALNQSGNFQQGYNQAVLNAPYQNELQKLAYPFQTAQYLAGITGGLSGAMGGTTTGQGTTTQPAPSIWSQLLGAGTAAVGGLGASGAFGNNGWMTGNGGSGNYGSIGVGDYRMPTVGYNAYANRGGRFAAGGAAPTWMDAADSLVPDVQVQSQANSGAKLDLAPKAQSQSQGPGLADIAKLAMMFINTGGRVKAAGGAVNASNPWASYADGGWTGGPEYTPWDAYNAEKMAAYQNMMASQSPEAVNRYEAITQSRDIPPHHLVSPGAMEQWDNYSPRMREKFNSGAQGRRLRADGGGVEGFRLGNDYEGMNFPTYSSGPVPEGYQNFINARLADDGSDPTAGQGQAAHPPLFADRFDAANPALDFSSLPQAPNFDQRFAGDGSAPPMDFAALPQEPDLATSGEPFRLDPDAMQQWRQGTDLAAGRGIEGPADLPQGATPTQGGTPSPPMANPQTQFVHTGEFFNGLDRKLPYPDLDPKNDVSRNFAKSPWMALISAGAGMMAGTSPFAGINIGKGLQAGAETLQQQRKDLATEQGVNQRARQLMLEAQKHIDQYTKMTPYQQGQLENQKLVNQRLIAAMNMKGWKLASENSVSGEKIWVQDGTNNVRIMKDGMLTTGSLDDPKSFRVTKIGKDGNPESIKELPKSEQPDPPMGQPELSSNLVPDAVPDSDKNIYRKGSPAMAAATASIKKSAQDFAKEASLAPQTEALLAQMKQAYGILHRDNDKDGFFTKLATLPGEGVDQRIDYAIKANGLAAAAGKAPIVNPEKLAAMENIRKSQNKLGMLFASVISAREAWAGQEAAIRSTPGLTQSPQGMLRMLASYEMVDQIARDKRQYFNNYVQKNGIPGNWEAEFHKKNPQDRYLVRSMMENLPNRRAAEKLPEAIKILRANPKDPEVIKGFNKLYGNTASFWLTGKLDTLGAQ